MRKIALMLAAALAVSAPMLVTSSTESLGASKARQKAAAVAAPAEENGAFFRAFTDQLNGVNTEVTGTKAGRRGASRKKGKSS
jgi:hypothetical protein